MEPWTGIAIRLLLLAGMLIGLFGLVVPVFPGITVIWVLVILHGIIFGFSTLGIVLFVIITLLTIAGWVSDNLIAGAKAREQGAHWLSIIAAFVVGFIASIILTPIGGIIATLLTILLVEYAYNRDMDRAITVMQNLFYGWGWAFIARFIIGLVMIILWSVWAWFG